MLSQNKQIKIEIEGLISQGFVKKQKIYDKVVDNLDVPRATVRRVGMELFSDHMKIAKILQPIKPKHGS